MTRGAFIYFHLFVVSFSFNGLPNHMIAFPSLIKHPRDIQFYCHIIIYLFTKLATTFPIISWLNPSLRCWIILKTIQWNSLSAFAAISPLMQVPWVILTPLEECSTTVLWSCKGVKDRSRLSELRRKKRIQLQVARCWSYKIEIISNSFTSTIITTATSLCRPWNWIATNDYATCALQFCFRQAPAPERRNVSLSIIQAKLKCIHRLDRTPSLFDIFFFLVLNTCDTFCRHLCVTWTE